MPFISLARNAQGASSVEYLVGLVLVALVAFGAFELFGGATATRVACTAHAIAGEGAGCGPASRGATVTRAPPAPAPSASAAEALVAPGAPTDARSRLASALARLPAPVIDALVAQGARILPVRDNVAEVDPSLRTVRPRGWQPGDTFSNVSSAYLPATNEIVVALDGTNEELAHRLAHEIGHALDLPRGLSTARAFRGAYTAVHFEAGSYMAQPGRAGADEAFAESFALYATDPARLRRDAPSMFAYWSARARQSFAAPDSERLASAGATPRPFKVLGWDPVETSDSLIGTVGEVASTVSDAYEEMGWIATSPIRALTSPVSTWQAVKGSLLHPVDTSWMGVAGVKSIVSSVAHEPWALLAPSIWPVLVLDDRHDARQLASSTDRRELARHLVGHAGSASEADAAALERKLADQVPLRALQRLTRHRTTIDVGYDAVGDVYTPLTLTSEDAWSYTDAFDPYFNRITYGVARPDDWPWSEPSLLRPIGHALDMFAHRPSRSDGFERALARDEPGLRMTHLEGGYNERMFAEAFAEYYGPERGAELRARAPNVYAFMATDPLDLE